ncbi:tyrosine-type recombinase/integrase [Desulforegula conservatrix]|uniref:tyrosine-type recombinase/integrase n=1 Tax=Desulforegula conservatrix TaxID=153026 RepID=UPI0003FC6411|nr:tyrosine-type recombinase/integrase [Desulforegula conservatrix]
MSTGKDIKSKKFNGLYYRELSDGDRTYYALVTIAGKSQRFCLGKHSEGVNLVSANQARIDIINKARYGEEALSTLPLTLAKKKKKKIISFADVAGQYIDARVLSDATKAEYSSILKFMEKMGIKSKDLHAITQSDVNSIQNNLLNEKRSSSTINKYIGFIKSVFNYGIRQGIIKSTNPANASKPLKENNERQRYLSKDEVGILIDSVRKDQNLLLFCLLGLQTGARLESILHIQVKDLDFENDTITLHNIKSKKTYKGFFSGELKLILNDQFKGCNNPNDFIITFNGQQTTARQIQCRLKPILDRLFNQGLDSKDSKNRVVIHTLRHTIASHLAIQGTPIHEIKKVMDHSSITETMRYAKLAPDSGKESVRKLWEGL